ncbi:Cystathionine gamma-synthase 1, chloroplastic [Capsicum chinense]|nr:Cystathionine gamma-synthase 1, chloroplastic [Capsicum chinense]
MPKEIAVNPEPPEPRSRISREEIRSSRTGTRLRLSDGDNDEYDRDYNSAMDQFTQDLNANDDSEMNFDSEALHNLDTFPPNFVRQLSVKARRNCSNLGLAQVVAALWSNIHASPDFIPTAKAVDATAAIAPLDITTGDKEMAVVENSPCAARPVQIEDLTGVNYSSFLSSDGSIAIHAGERRKDVQVLNMGAMGTPLLLLHAGEKISALEGAESTLLMASGMCASTAMLLALVPAGGHIVTTTDCYRKTRIFIETILPKMGITATVIDPADIGALESVLSQKKVTLFFTESPTNPFLRCVDIELVSKLCHEKGALVCIDGGRSQHPLTKSGPDKLVSAVRNLHHILGGSLNPNAAYLMIRGMKTLNFRVQQQNSTVQRIAEILEAHPKVRCVYYPGLSSYPEHHLAKRQMTGFGGVVSFEVDGDLLIDYCKIC